MGYGAREAVARRQRAKFARIGYAIRQKRRDRYPRLPIRLAGQMTSAGALGFSLFEPKRPADNSGGDVPVASPPTAPSLPAEAPAAPQRSKIPTAGGALPPSRRQLEELERRDAPALFDLLTQDGSRSAVAAVQRRAWRLEERKEQALGMARVLDGTARVDPTFRGRCFASWSIAVCELTTFTFADFSPEFDRVLHPRPRGGRRYFLCGPAQGPVGMAAARSFVWIYGTHQLRGRQLSQCYKWKDAATAARTVSTVCYDTLCAEGF